MAAPAAAAAAPSGHTPTPLADMMDIAALNHEEKEYVKAKGLISVRHFRRSFVGEADVIRDLIDPYLHGVTIEEVEHKSTRATLSRTCLLVLFDLVHEATSQPPPIFHRSACDSTGGASSQVNRVGPVTRGLARGRRRVGEQMDTQARLQDAGIAWR